MRPWMVGVSLVLLLAGLLVAANSFTTMTYFCSECAVDRRDLRVMLPSLRSMGTLRRKVTPTEFTVIVKGVDPGPCAHRWVFAVGSGGSFA